MPPPRLPSCRVHLAPRSLRTSNDRHFSQKHPRLLLISTSSPRPQLPFLYPSALNRTTGHFQISRLISTENKKFIKQTAKLTAKFTLYFWLITTSATIASYGFLSERQERAFPSPHEWSLYTRFRFRSGRWFEVPEHNQKLGFPDWAKCYKEYRIALRRLEDPEIDGAGILEQVPDEAAIPGVGKAGYDLTAKSGEWRQGYYEVLMGMGQAAEQMDGWVTNKWEKQAWSPEFIASPTNPRPKVPPPGMDLPPPEDQRLPVTEPPETFYLKILTSKGFTTGQRVKAAVAYGDWLSFKELHSSAEEMYRWALDIAKSGLPKSDASTVINPKTSVLSISAPKETITSNLVFATTSLATHLATTGNITSALPILVSLLRARRSADAAPKVKPEPPKDSTVIGTLTTLFQEPEYPPLPPTGDEPLLRKEEDVCDEAILMNHIGEILFATAKSKSQREQGLHWVRDAVEQAKSAQSIPVISMDPKRKEKCQQCEEVGLESWGKIMTYLIAEAEQQRENAKSSWLTTQSGVKKAEEAVKELEVQEGDVAQRLSRLRQKMLQEFWADEDMKFARKFAF